VRMLRNRLWILAAGLVAVLGLLTGAPARGQDAVGTSLPVERVVLYKSGIGYFEHVGQVDGDRDVAISFTSAQLDDVLKTLTVLDLDGGRVTDIGYDSLAPIEQRLRNVRLPIGDTPSFFDLLSALRGARVEVRLGTEAVAGRVLSAEQGWAIVDNTVGEDWKEVELSLVSGAPQSFVQQISRPYYARRPVVPLPEHAQSSPQTHAPTLTAGSGRVGGEVRDGDGAPLPGVRVTAVDADGTVTARALTGPGGGYALGPLAAGTYRVSFELSGFQTDTDSVSVRGATEIRRDNRLALDRVEENVTVTSAATRCAPGPGGSRR